MKLPAYPRTKPSGAEWLGDVPDHWKVNRLRHVLSRNDGGVWGEDDDPEGTVILRSTEQTVDGGWQIADPARRNLTPKEKSVALLKAGDLVVTKSSGSALHIGKTSLVSKEIEALQPCYSNFMQRLRAAPGFEPRLVFYVLNSPTGRQQLVFNSNTTTGLANLNAGVLGDVFIATPPPAEQRAIAAFLDLETGRADRLVAKKRELIERLKEKRTALISRTVTRGLPPAAARAACLPENPPLKPSGLEWLDDVPVHWEVLPLKRVAQISYGVGGEIDRSLEEGLRIFSLPNIDIEGTLNFDDVPFAEVSETEKRAVLLRKGDLLFNWRNGSSDHLGKTAYFDADGDYSHVSFLLRIRFEPEEHCSRFFRYLIIGYRVTGFFKHSKAGVNNTFNMSELSALPVMFPPLPEQAAIAAYLDKETAKLDALVGKVEEAVERLQEYRTALITAAVTGKIDVRGTRESAGSTSNEVASTLPP